MATGKLQPLDRSTFRLDDCFQKDRKLDPDIGSGLVFGGYAVFGKVTDGLDVVDAIRKVKTGNAGFHQDVPTEDVVIEKASVLEE